MKLTSSLGASPQYGLHYSNRVPLEIWLQIVEYLPRQSIKACLQVCRTSHDAAVGILFSTTRLYFCPLHFPAGWTSDEEHKHLGSRLIRNSVDIIFSIVNDPSFAYLIKHLIVYSRGKCDNDDRLLFETRCLANALVYLPRLESFEWRGTFIESSIPDELLSNLIKSCSQLRHIRFPFSHSQPVPTADLWSLKNLDSIADFSVQKTHLAPSMLSGVGIHHYQLPHILSPSCIPQSAIAHLHDLTLNDPPYLHGLLAQAQSLASLSLFNVKPRFRRTLSEATGHLPLLSSFTLTTAPPTTQITEIIEFLSDRPSMKRLCLRIHQLKTWHSFRQVGSAIEAMGGLEALAIDGPQIHTDSEEAEMNSFLDRLPSSLQLLDLKVPDYGFEALIQHVSNLPLLTFLTVATNSHYCESQIEQMTHILALHFPNLMHLVFDDNIVDVERDPNFAIARPRPWSALRRLTVSSISDLDPSVRWLMKVSPPVTVGVEDSIYT